MVYEVKEENLNTEQDCSHKYQYEVTTGRKGGREPGKKALCILSVP